MEINTVILLVIIGLLAGFVSGSMGVGGGIIIIPASVFVLGLSQHQAQGTNLAVLSVPVVLIGAINYYKKGYVNIKFALIIVLAFIIGSYFGSKLAVALPDKLIKKIFGFFMLLVSLKYIFTK